METKTCTKCKFEKSIDEFAKNSSRKDGLHNICKPCKKEYNTDYYGRTKHVYKESRAERRKRMRRDAQRFVLSFLSTHPCVDCGETDVVVLQFDHQRDKIAAIAQLINLGASVKRIAVEIEKCEVVCANDHARRTATQFGWYKRC